MLHICVVFYVCVPAWPWTLQPSERAYAHNNPPGEKHQTDLCWSLPQLSMDHPLYLDEKLRYTDTVLQYMYILFQPMIHEG